MTVETKKFIKKFNKKGINSCVYFDSFRFNDERSIICKVSKDFFPFSKEGLMTALYWENCLNMQLICDDQRMSNFDMASFLYCPHTDLIYCIPYSVSNNFIEGKEVVIYGKEPDEEDRKMIKECF